MQLPCMVQATHNKIVSFIWGIADDVLRDLFVRGKYRDVILPMCVLPYTPDAWIKQDATKIGYEISFTHHFYKPQLLRTLEEIRAGILALEKEAEAELE